jgi:quercetin dioxygenase-like cupin family protein
MPANELEIVTTNSNQGQVLRIAGGEYRIIIAGCQTNGLYAVIEMSGPPNAGPVPHAHPVFDESLYVLEGEVSFMSENGVYLAKKDSFVSIPQDGIIHSFKNLTGKPAKLLCTVIPAGLDRLFVEVAELMETIPAIPDLKEKIHLISNKYGRTIFSQDYWG